MFFRSKRKQKGVYFLETAITLPIFVLLLYGLVDISKLINAHILAAHLAYEGARLASKTQGLLVDNTDTSSPQKKVASESGKTIIKEKLANLLEKHGMPRAKIDQNLNDLFTIEVKEVDEKMISYSGDNNHLNTGKKLPKISVTVSLPSIPIIGLFDTKGVTTSTSTIDYLFIQGV